MKEIDIQIDDYMSIVKWIRSRIRLMGWKRWKKVRIRFENLKRLGIKEEKARMWKNTRKAPGARPMPRSC